MTAGAEVLGCPPNGWCGRGAGAGSVWDGPAVRPLCTAGPGGGLTGLRSLLGSLHWSPWEREYIFMRREREFSQLDSVQRDESETVLLTSSSPGGGGGRRLPEEEEANPTCHSTEWINL